MVRAMARPFPGGALRAANGAAGARSSTTTRNVDGSVAHQGGFQTRGAKGSVNSSGGYIKDSDGKVSGSRNTSTTGASGNSYAGSTTYSIGKLQHSGTCTDAGDVAIPCR